MSFYTEVAADSPYLWYKLNETSGTTATNAGSASSANGTYTNSPTINQTGFHSETGNKAVSFSGANNSNDPYIALGSGATFNADLDDNDKLTIEVLVKPSSSWPTSGNRQIIRAAASGNGYRMSIHASGETQIPASFHVNAGGIKEINPSDLTYTKDAWNHVVMTWERVSGTGWLRTYKNGELKDEVSFASSDALSLSGNTADIARNGGFNSGYFAGLIDEVIIYRSTLSTARVQKHAEELGLWDNPSPTVNAEVTDIEVTGLEADVDEGDVLTLIQPDTATVDVAGVDPFEVFASVKQTLRPNSTSRSGVAWSGNHLDVDEVTPNDNDYIHLSISATQGGTHFGTITFGLTDLIGLIDIKTGHILRMRSLRGSGSGSLVLTYNLFQVGSHSVKSGSLPVGTSATTTTITLSQAEAASITNYDALTLSFSGTVPSGWTQGSTYNARVTWAEFELPENSSPNSKIEPNTATVDVAANDTNVWPTHVPASDAGAIDVEGLTHEVFRDYTVFPNENLIDVTAPNASQYIDAYRDLVMSRNNLKYYWRLDELTGNANSTKIASHSGNRIGVYNGDVVRDQPGIVSGQNKSTLFNGGNVSVNNFLVTLDEPGTSNNNRGWVEAWVYIESYKADSGGVSATIIESDAFAIRVKPTGALEVSKPNASAGTHGRTTSAGVVQLNRWNHIAVKFLQLSLVIYVNGVQPSSTAFGTEGALSAASSTLYIGGNTNRWQGYIDEVAIYTTNEAESSFVQHYNTVTNLVATTAAIEVQGLDASTDVSFVGTVDAEVTNIEVQAHTPSFSAGGMVTIGASTSELLLVAPQPEVTIASEIDLDLTLGFMLVQGLDAKIRIRADDLEFKFIPSNETGFTALGSDELVFVNFGAALHGSRKITSFRLGNASPIDTYFVVKAESLNSTILPGVEFSLDKGTWSPSVTTNGVGVNAISDVIYVRLTVPPGVPIGNSSFVIDVEQYDA